MYFYLITCISGLTIWIFLCFSPILIEDQARAISFMLQVRHWEKTWIHFTPSVPLSSIFTKYPATDITYDGNNNINKLCRSFLDKTLHAAVRMCGCVILCESIYDLMCACVGVSVIYLHVCACVAQVSIFFFLFLLIKTYELLYWMERFFSTLFYLFFKVLFQWMHTCVFL